MRIIFDDGHQAGGSSVRVVRLVSMTDSTTKKLHQPLTGSNSHRGIACVNLIQQSLMSVGFRKNKYWPSSCSKVSSKKKTKTVVMPSDRRNTVLDGRHHSAD